MCIGNMKSILPGSEKADEEQQQNDLKATDVPLGEGMLGQARLSILSRREQIRRAVEGGM